MDLYVHVWFVAIKWAPSVFRFSTAVLHPPPALDKGFQVISSVVGVLMTQPSVFCT